LYWLKGYAQSLKSFQKIEQSSEAAEKLKTAIGRCLPQNVHTSILSGIVGTASKVQWEIMHAFMGQKL